MARLSLSLLGPFEAILNGQPVTAFESVKVRALLAFLAVEADRPHSRADLAELLWPNQPGETARTYLRHVLGNLKAALTNYSATPPFLSITRDTIQLNTSSAVSLDVANFAKLLAECETHPHRRRAACTPCAHRRAAAVALYRGDLLAQVFVSDSVAFEEWAAQRRERLRQQALDALDQLEKYHHERHELDTARRYAVQHVELEPWDEQAQRQLITLLWQSSQYGAAMAQYYECRRVLQQELGVEPDAETTALHRRLQEWKGDVPPPEPPIPWSDLPMQVTPLVGRTAELAMLGEMLQNPTCRLISLTGLGGIGKTRLALQAALQERANFADGMCYVPLSALATPELIAPTLVTALACPPGNMDAQTRLLRFLYNKELLLVLDNFEHLLSGASLLMALLEHAPKLCLLVTSRERLRMQCEWVLELEGLHYPPPEGQASADSYEAEQLYVATARRATSQFILSAENRTSIARICRLVEGMPLGIELAAAWTRALSCQTIAVELERSIDVLAGELHGLADRHRSLRAVLNYSWKRLEASEQRALQNLAVFRGGWERTAALEVAGAGPRLLAALIDRCLVRHTAGERYDLHELVRRYAAEQLHSAEEQSRLCRQHAAFFVRLAEAAAPELESGKQDAWLERLDRDHDNLRAALSWALDNDPDMALRLASALGIFWVSRGLLHEGKNWLELALAGNSGADKRLRARALWLSGWLAWLPGQVEQANALFNTSLALAQQVDDQRLLARALAGIGSLHQEGPTPPAAVPVFETALLHARQCNDRWTTLLLLWQLATSLVGLGKIDQATALYTECVVLARDTGEQIHKAQALYYLGGLALLHGQLAVAREYLEEGLAGAQHWSLLGVSHVPEMLGRVLAAQHDLAEARRRLVHCVRGYQAAGSTPCICHALEGFARLALLQNHPVAAAQLLGAIQSWEANHGLTMRPVEQLLFDQTVAAVRAALLPAAFADAWQHGVAMSLERAVELALEEAGEHP